MARLILAYTLLIWLLAERFTSSNLVDSSPIIGWLVGQWQDCNVTCGGGWQWRDVYCAERQNNTATGKVENLKVHNKYCFQSKKPDIGRPCSQQNCPVWEASDWSQCSVTCGKGIRSRVIDCRQERFQSVNRFACDPKSKPNPKQTCYAGSSCEEAEENRVADYERYRYVASAPFTHWGADSAIGGRFSPGGGGRGGGTQPSYQPGPWSQCSTTCGPGVKTRTVKCAVFQAITGNVLNLPDFECQDSHSSRTPPYTSDSPAPPPFMPCEERRCPPKSDAGGGKDVTPGGGSRKLSIGRQYRWDYGDWGQCSASCLGGKQKSTLKCVDLNRKVSVAWSYCDPKQRPYDVTRSCNNQPCPPRWQIDSWTVCSHSCGKGVRTRRVRCVRQIARAGSAESTLILPDKQCPPMKPLDREICGVADCPPKWRAQSWAQCSRTCGPGNRRRLVLCEQRTADGKIRQFNPPTQCDRADKPHPFELCNLGACKSSSGQSHRVSSTNPFSKPRPNSAKNFEQVGDHHRFTLRIGGRASLFEGTSVKVKCPVKNFDRTKIVWTKDGRLLRPTSRRVRVSKFGALRISKAKARDAGLYACIAGTVRGNITLAFKPRFRWGSFGGGRKDLKTNELPSREQEGIIDRDDDDDVVDLKEKASDAKDEQTLKALTTNSAAVYKQQQNSAPAPVSAAQMTDSKTPIEQLKDYLLRHNKMDVYNALASANDRADVVRVEWIVAPWTDCPRTCGPDAGMQFRRIQCKVDVKGASTYTSQEMCTVFGLPRQAETKVCSPGPCPQWQEGEWSQCATSRCVRFSTSLQRRKVLCIAANGTQLDNKFCARKSKPRNKQECFNRACVAVWRASAWGPCTKTCGDDGVEMRFIRCVWNGTRKAAGKNCQGAKHPKLMRPCRQTLPCPGDATKPKEMAGPFKGGECTDESRHCSLVQVLRLCDSGSYRRQCCLTCNYTTIR